MSFDGLGIDNPRRASARTPGVQQRGLQASKAIDAAWVGLVSGQPLSNVWTNLRRAVELRPDLFHFYVQNAFGVSEEKPKQAWYEDVDAVEAGEFDPVESARYADLPEAPVQEEDFAFGDEALGR